MENQPAITRILVAVTQSGRKGYPHPSKKSKQAFQWILETLVRSNFAGFSLQFVHVQHPNSPSERYFKGRDLLNYFLDRCNLIGVHCDSWIEPGGDTRTAICREVRRVNPDLLVMGRGRFGIFGDNVSEYCLKHAECPVAIVKLQNQS